MRVWKLVFIHCLVLAAFAGKPGRPVSFPSKAPAAVSPDGQFAIVSVDSTSEPRHTLFLETRGSTGSRRKLLDYERQVTIIWNPTSSAFAVTNYSGSNVAECLVFLVSTDDSPMDVAGGIQQGIRNPQELASLRKNDHLYYAAIRWTSAQTLRVKVWGHGDANPSGFRRVYTYHLPAAR